MVCSTFTAHYTWNKLTRSPYTYVPNSGAINALTAPATENSIMTRFGRARSPPIRPSPSRSAMVRTMRRRLPRRQDRRHRYAKVIDRFNTLTGVLVGADV